MWRSTSDGAQPENLEFLSHLWRTADMDELAGEEDTAHFVGHPIVRVEFADFR